MKSFTKILVIFASAISLILTSSFGAYAADKPNKKRGQVYFKMVCTVCHMSTAEKTIPPADYTMEQWDAYFEADAHDKSGKTNPKVSYYVSTEYRKSISDTNKAAKRFLKLSDEQLFADVRKFAVNGAKDSDTPATCN
jgi:mono/diheme cytochrome c family protein